MAKPLDGVRVIDWTIWQQGPVCGALLADLGAEVIKIEDRVKGDPGRGIGRLFGVDLSSRPNFYFEANNRGKKSITLDLKKPEALEIVYRLTERADVFLQNFRKGVAQRLRLDYDTLRRRNPRLIYASATGYGMEGPDSGEPSFDQMGLARSGIMLAAGEPGMPPLAIAGGIADQMGAVTLAYGVLAAIIARERHGMGQEVDASHLGSMMLLQGLSVSAQLMMGAAIPRVRRANAVNPLWNHYRCADGEWIMLGMLQPDRYWADLCRAVGRPDLADDPRFADHATRARNSVAAVAILDEVFATRPRDAWLAILRTAPGDFIYTYVNSVSGLPEDPQVIENEYVVDFEHPQHGPTQVLGMAVRLSETPGDPRTAAPEFGQHTEEVLTEILDYGWDDIAALREKDVI